MDLNSLPTRTRKVKFAPKAPPIRKQEPVVAKVEKVEDAAEVAQAQELLRRFNESYLKVRPKTERKVGATRVAFGQGGSYQHSPKSYGGGGAKKEFGVKEYKEPWDYYSNYPVTLPLRTPYSGDPEVLDEAEFKESSEGQTYDEGSTNAAVQLGLLDQNTEPTMIFLQFPSKLPMPKEDPSKEPKPKEDPSKLLKPKEEPDKLSKPKEEPDKEEASNKPGPSNSKGPANKLYALHELPAGYMGKLVIYKSGAVKLKLGDNLYDVDTGVDSTFAQDVVAINTREKSCSALGEINKRAIITPDLDSIFDTKFDL